MLSEQEIEAIKARVEAAGRESVSYTGRDPSSYVKWPGCVACREDVPALLADRAELRGLAKEMAEGLRGLVEPSVYAAANSWYVNSAKEALAKARAAGFLLETEA